MFTIRNGQMDEFEKATRVNFRQRLSEFLRDELPDDTASFDDRALVQRIVESETRAAKYGIETESGIAQWVCLTFAAGVDFDEIPEVQEYLTEPDPHVDSEEKLDVLAEMLDDDDSDDG